MEQNVSWDVRVFCLFSLLVDDGKIGWMGPEIVTTVMIMEAEVASSEPRPLGHPCKCKLRARAKITSHFRIPSSGYLCPILNRKILERALLLLWFCDFRSNKDNLNLGANSVKLFLSEP